MKFNEKLRFLREEKGYTQDEIASKLNIARQSVSKWEQGINEPDFDTIKKLCLIFDCTIADLIDDDKEVKTTKEEKNKKRSQWIYHISLIIPLIMTLSILAMVIASGDEVVIHIGSDGSKTMGSKWMLLIVLIFAVLGFLISVLIKRITSKGAYSKYIMTYSIIGLIVNVVLLILSLVIVPLMASIPVENITGLIIACTLGFIGGVSLLTHPKVNAQNLLFGFKSNLTLSSKKAWDKMNAFCSITLFFCTIAGYIFVLIFIDKEWSIAFFTGSIFVGLIISGIYHEIVRKEISKEKEGVSTK